MRPTILVQVPLVLCLSNHNMNSCTRCEALDHKEYIPPSTDSYVPGDFISIEESVHAPIVTIFGDDTSLQSRRGSNTSNGSSIRSQGLGGKNRPSIVLERRSIETVDANEETVALLLATYDGKHRFRHQLPLVLQFFCVAVHPHSDIAEDLDAFHLHTSPEWSNSRKDAGDLHAWLILHRFTSRGPTKGRWRNEKRIDRASHSSFRLDDATHIKIIEIIEEKWEAWEANCNDPEFKTKYVQDYIVSVLRFLPSAI